MDKTLGEIAQIVGGELAGDSNIRIRGLSGIKEAAQDDLTFLANPVYLPLLEKTKAAAVLVARDMSGCAMPHIRTDNPSLAFAKLASLVIGDRPHPEPGMHATAVIAADARIGTDVYLGPHVVVESKAVIGDGSIIYSGCFIGHDTSVGTGCLIYPNTTIREWVSVGNRVIIHSGTVIGSDGFGFVNTKGVHEKIPQIGTVVIEDDVEIGANVTVDRARFDKTVIGRGTKIDNLVQIAHNVVIGENSIIIAQAGIAGSTMVGAGVIVAAQAGVVGHLTIGEGAIIAAQSGVSKSVPAHTQVFGSPAKPVTVARRVNAALQRLPHYVAVIAELKTKVEALQQKQTKNPAAGRVQKKSKR